MLASADEWQHGSAAAHHSVQLYLLLMVEKEHGLVGTCVVSDTPARQCPNSSYKSKKLQECRRELLMRKFSLTQQVCVLKLWRTIAGVLGLAHAVIAHGCLCSSCPKTQPQVFGIQVGRSGKGPPNQLGYELARFLTNPNQIEAVVVVPYGLTCVSDTERVSAHWRLAACSDGSTCCG
eukprot:3248302-Amphidinium_carterae.1